MLISTVHHLNKGLNLENHSKDNKKKSEFEARDGSIPSLKAALLPVKVSYG